MLIGYARTSTEDQVAGFEAQLGELTTAGCKKIFQEQVSSVAERDQLTELLSYVRDGDTVVVTKLDRLARSVAHLLSIVASIEARGASLRILAMQLDTSTATGKLMLTTLGAVAEFERSMMLERQRVGIAKAKAEGRYKGRPATAMKQGDAVRTLMAEGLGAVAIADRLGISRASVWRISRALDASASIEPGNVQH